MRVFLIGLAMAVIALIMTLLAMGHDFSVDGGAIYYGIVIGLGAGSAFVIPIGWGIMASKC
jgi:hypothetical protein